MTWLSIILALIAEISSPSRWQEPGKALGERLYNECEINLGQLGLPNWRHLEWLVPVALMGLLAYVIEALLSALGLGLNYVFELLLILHIIEFRRVMEKLTLVQLMLNQGDLAKAEAMLDKWQSDYEGQFQHHPGHSLTIPLLAHAGERSFRQLFVPIFWLWLGGPSVLAIYAATWYAVRVQRLAHLAISEATNRPTLAHDMQADWTGAVLTPRFLLFLLEWVPAKLLVLLIALLNGSIDVLQAIREAAIHTPWSNRAKVVAAWVHASDASDSQSDYDVAPLVKFRILLAKVLAAMMLLMLLVNSVLSFGFA